VRLRATPTELSEQKDDARDIRHAEPSGEAGMLERGYQASLLQSSPVAGEDPGQAGSGKVGKGARCAAELSPLSCDSTHLPLARGSLLACAPSARLLARPPASRSTNFVMTHIAFAHDHAFYEDVEGHVHSRGGQFGQAILRRYVDLFGNVTVIARSQPLASYERVEGMSRADGAGVSFCLLGEGRGGLNRVLGFSARRAMLERTLAGVDGLIARLPSVMGSEACRAAERCGLPWAVEVVGSAWDALMAHGDLAAKAYAPIAHLRTRAIVSRAGAALYVTQSFLQRCYPTRAPSIGLSDVELPDPDPHTLALRIARIESRPSPLRIGLIGSVGPSYKGIDTVLHALAKVRDRLGAFEFWVLGHGDPFRHLDLARSLGIASFVTFCGTLPAGAPVRSWLDAVDVYVQPSRMEGLPRSLLEALSRGCPALGSRIGGIPELLEHRWLHRPGDDSALGELLLQVTQPQIMLALARRNFSLASGFAARELDARRRKFWAAFATRISDFSHGKRDSSGVRERAVARLS